MKAGCDFISDYYRRPSSVDGRVYYRAMFESIKLNTLFYSLSDATLINNSRLKIKHNVSVDESLLLMYPYSNTYKSRHIDDVKRHLIYSRYIFNPCT